MVHNEGDMKMKLVTLNPTKCVQMYPYSWCSTSGLTQHIKPQINLKSTILDNGLLETQTAFYIYKIIEYHSRQFSTEICVHLHITMSAKGPWILNPFGNSIPY